MNVTVTILTVVMGLALTNQALIFVSALLATPSTLLSDNALVNNACMININMKHYSYLKPVLNPENYYQIPGFDYHYALNAYHAFP